MHREGTFGTVALLGRFPAVRTGVDVSGTLLLLLVSLLRRHDPQAGKVWVHRAIRAMGGVLVGIALGNAVVLVGRG